MTAREESAPRILGPRINYRTERDNGGEALHVTVAFNACVPVLQPAGTPSAPTWSRVRDMCGDGAAEYVSCCGNDFSDLTKELAVFTRGWSAAAFVVEARDGRLIAAAAKGQGLEVVRITPGEVHPAPDSSPTLWRPRGLRARASRRRRCARLHAPAPRTSCTDSAPVHRAVLT
jgi:hypothetical protein